MLMSYFDYIKIATIVSILPWASCSDDWNNHYDVQEGASTQSVEVFKGNVADYLNQHSEFSTISGLFSSNGLSSLTQKGNSCTLIIPSNDVLSDAGVSASNAGADYVKSCIADVPVPPSSLTNYYGIYTQNGKYLWVTSETGDPIVLNDNYNVTKTVKADNGYIYVVDGVIPVRQNIREYIMGLDQDYSIIQDYIRSFESTYFDAANATPAGVDAAGNTYYSDSAANMKIRNTLLDRYNSDGIQTWNMIDETYLSTVFIPNNEMVLSAFNGAMDSVRVWLNREPTTRGNSLYPTLCDSTKFVKWIVKSCFINRRLEPNELMPNNHSLIECVGDYVLNIDEQTDSRTCEKIDPAYWQPSSQWVDYEHPVELSNGRAFFVTKYKVPQQIVLYRIKSRFNYNASHGLFEAMKDSVLNNPTWLERNTPAYDYDVSEDKELAYRAFFRENHLFKPRACSEGELGVSFQDRGGTYYPDMELDPYYTVVWIPDSISMADSLAVGVETQCMMYNPTDKNYGAQVARVPSGEYYLRMGLGRNLVWTTQVYFADDTQSQFTFVNEICTATNGTDYAMDRGGAMEGMEFFGMGSIGLQEYYDWEYWYNQGNTKATAYDTDGGNIGVVRVGCTGYDEASGTYLYDGKTHTVRLKFVCPSLAREYWNNQFVATNGSSNAWYTSSAGTVYKYNESLYYNRVATNGFQFKLYHWCLRPTPNNY